jgi:hypothetical protein
MHRTTEKIAMRVKSPTFLPAMLGVILNLTTPLHAAVTNYVTSTEDSGPGSLRQAMLDVNARGGGAIQFSNVMMVRLLGELPPIQVNMLLLNVSSNRVVLDGGRRGRVLTIASGGTATLKGLRITAGSVTMAGSAGEGTGGGILNRGNLTLIDSLIDDNSVVGIVVNPTILLKQVCRAAC